MGEHTDRRILRKMKIISDQAGIMNRYMREQENWKPHLENTKNYITSFIEKNDYRSVSILGSGWLLDLPVEYLKEHTDEVVLYDIFHPPQIKHKLRNDRKFKLVESDITGGVIHAAYQAYRNFKARKNDFNIHTLISSGFAPVKATDCFISLNILNQLDILIIDFLKQNKIGSPEEYSGLRANIQQSHIKSLPTGKSCLITDAEELVIEKEGKIKEIKSLIYTSLTDGLNIKKWQWEFDFSGTYNVGYNTMFNVIAMEI
ncbi:MAG: hypothetical protein R6W78_07080 [Bacteroidales bacterium]